MVELAGQGGKSPGVRVITSANAGGRAIPKKRAKAWAALAGPNGLSSTLKQRQEKFAFAQNYAGKGCCRLRLSAPGPTIHLLRRAAAGRPADHAWPERS